MTIGDVQLISSFFVSAPPTKFAAKCDMIPGLGSGRGRGGRQAANLMALLDTDPHLDPTVITKTSDRVSRPRAESWKV